MVNNLDYIYNTQSNIKPYNKANIRTLTPLAFSELQQAIKIYNKLFPNAKTPEKTITEYQNKYNVSKNVAKSDYIWLWTRYLQSETNRLAKRVQSLKDDDTIITAIDYIPRTQDYNTSMSALDFIRRIKHHLPYLATYSKKSTYETASNALEDQLIRSTLEDTQEALKKLKKIPKQDKKQIQDILKAEQVNVNLFHGKYNLLAVRNLYQGLRHVGWNDAITVLNNLTYDEILRFWEDERETFDLVFLYDDDFDVESTSEIVFLSSLYKYGSEHVQDVIDTLIDNNQIRDDIQRSF